MSYEINCPICHYALRHILGNVCKKPDCTVSDIKEYVDHAGGCEEMTIRINYILGINRTSLTPPGTTVTAPAPTTTLAPGMAPVPIPAPTPALAPAPASPRESSYSVSSLFDLFGDELLVSIAPETTGGPNPGLTTTMPAPTRVNPGTVNPDNFISAVARKSYLDFRKCMSRNKGKGRCEAPVKTENSRIYSLCTNCCKAKPQDVKDITDIVTLLRSLCADD